MTYQFNKIWAQQIMDHIDLTHDIYSKSDT